jgi:uncharacterized Zn finger protein (UPF0148 family)
MKYKSGDRLGNTTLYVEQTYYSKVICRCQKCLESDVYTEEELDFGTGCRICDNISREKQRLVISPTTDMKNVAKLYAKQTYRSGSTVAFTMPAGYKLDGVGVGSEFGQFRVQDFVGKVYRNGNGWKHGDPKQVVAICKYCETYSRLIDVSKVAEYIKTGKGLDVQCPCCGKIINEARGRVDALKKNKSEHLKKVVAKNNSNEAKKTTEDGISKLISRVKSPLDNVKPGSKIDKLLSKVKSMNADLDIQDIEPIKSSYKVVCTCGKCGTEVSVLSSNRSKEVECPGCKLKATDINYVGAYKRNYVGTTKNLMELLGRDGDTCTVKCNSCGRVYTNIKFYDWYKGKVICNCDNNTLTDVLCNECGEFMTIPLGKVIGKVDNTEEIVCNKCGAKSGHTYGEIYDDYLEAPSVAITTSNKLGVARKKLRESTEKVNNELVRTKEPLFIGTDGKMYYRCTCLIHDSDMILNDDEIAVFNHQQCTDARQHMMKDINKDNVKF